MGRTFGKLLGHVHYSLNVESGSLCPRQYIRVNHNRQCDAMNQVLQLDLAWATPEGTKTANEKCLIHGFCRIRHTLPRLLGYKHGDRLQIPPEHLRD